MFSVLSFRTTSTNNRLLIDGTVGWRLIFLGFAARQAKLRAERSLKSLRIVSPPILGRYNRRKPTRSPRQRGRAETGEWEARAFSAAFRFTIRSNFLGDCTGRSDGFAPRSIRSTYPASARNRSTWSKLYEARPPALGANG